MSLALVLMPINWHLEIKKWQLLTSSENRSTYQEAFSTVLRGLAYNIFIPFTVGDALSRYSRQRTLAENSKLILLSRGSSLMVTLIFGFGALALIFGLTWPYLLAICALVVIGYYITKSHFDEDLLIKISLISGVRYLVFSVQFLILLYFFNSNLSLDVIMSGIFIGYLVKSLVPSMLGGLGIRELSMITFFEPHVSNLNCILVPSLLLWIINLALPSIMGIYHMNRTRLQLIT